nr:MAG: host attachment protein [Hyphomicrobiales bacterium]
MKNLRHGTWIAIADGAKALVLKNIGEVDAPNLTLVDVFANADTGRTSDLGTDRPGRARQSASTGHTSFSETDWHQIGENKFAAIVAKALEKHCEAGDFLHLVVVAPARTLAELRGHYSKRVQDTILAEIDKDLTNHPLHKIEKILLAS